MSRQSRTLLFVVVIALGGMLVLAMMARRYGELLQESSVSARPTTELKADESEVDAFLRVRRAMRAELGRRTGTQVSLALVRSVRGQTLERVGMSEPRYSRLREKFQAWRQGRLSPSDPVRGVFERRRLELRQADLGPYESLDS